LTLGYRALEVREPCLLGQPGWHGKGHEFHYSSLVPTGPLRYACRLMDASGRDVGPDGLIQGRVLALYTHLHFASHPLLAKALVSTARQGQPLSEDRV